MQAIPKASAWGDADRPDLDFPSTSWAENSGATSSHGCSTAVGSPYSSVFFGTDLHRRRDRARDVAATSRATDWIISRLLDIVWAFPIYLLAISLSVILVTSGLDSASSTSARFTALAILIIASVYVPYVARLFAGSSSH